MKAILEFDLPQETHNHHDALNGHKWRWACQDLREDIRNWLKHGHTFKTPDEALEAVREHLLKSTSSLTQD